MMVVNRKNNNDKYLTTDKLHYATHACIECRAITTLSQHLSLTISIEII